MLPDPMDILTVVDLPNEGLIHLAETCGMSTVKVLLKKLPGQSFVAPKNGIKRVQDAAERRGSGKGPYIVEDFPSGFWRFIAEKCGTDVMMALFENAALIPIDIPKQPLSKILQRFITEHYNSKNEHEIAIHLGISRRTFFKILNQPLRSPKSGLKNLLQVSMF